jgi:hypothetical protein
VGAFALQVAAGTASADSTSAAKAQPLGSSTVGSRLERAVSAERPGPTSAVAQDSTTAHVRVLGRSTPAFRARGFAQRGGSGVSRGLGIEVNGSTIAIAGSLTISRNILTVGVQLWVGPVPVYVSAGCAVSLTASVGGGVAEGNPFAQTGVSGGLGLELTAGVGLRWAYIGIQGSASPLTATAATRVTFAPEWIKPEVVFWVGAAARVALVARLGWFSYSHSLASWSHPYAKHVLMSTLVR